MSAPKKGSDGSDEPFDPQPGCSHWSTTAQLLSNDGGCRKVASENFQSDKKNGSATEANANSLQQSGNNNVAMGNQIGNITTIIKNYNNPPECQPNSPEIDRTQSEETCSKFKNKLQCLYKKCILPCVHWIADGESFPMDEYYVQLEMSSADGESTKQIDLEELFQKQDRDIPKRILVESQPGFGKTTLATKLIFDWANGEKYLKQFELAFFIPLRQMQGKCLEEQIEEICADLKSRVNLNDDKHDKMLLVLDGFDEISPISRDNVLKVLYQFEFSEMTIIVTSRPGIFPMNSKKSQDLFQKHPQMKRDFHHKKVTIRGIGVEDRKRFLTKFCPKHNPQKVLDKIASLPANDEDMFSSPLLLLLISYFINLDMTVDVKSSLTDLYKSLFSNLVKSNLTREGKTISDQFDLFNVKDKTSRKCQKMLERFGILSLTKLRNDVFTFESDDHGFIKEIYKLGLLTKHKCIGIFKQKEHFECFHLSFMEFCIAYSAWRKFETHQFWQNTHTKLFEQIRHLIRMSGETTLIGLFLSGLLQQRVVTFLSHFNPSEYYNNVLLWKMIGQLKGNEQLAKSILNVLKLSIFTSEDQSKYFVDTEFFSYVMQNGILMRYIWLILPAMIDCILPVNIIVPNVRITLFRNVENETQKKCVNYLKQIQCETLDFHINGKLSVDLLFDEVYDYRSFPSDHFTFFLSIVASERKRLVIYNYNADSAFYHNCYDHFLNGTKFQTVSVTDLDNIAVVKMICALLETNSVYHLRLMFSDGYINYDGLQRIIDLAVQCKSLWELYVRNMNLISPPRMDVHQFIRKEWRDLHLSGFKFYCIELNKSLPCPRCQRGIKGMPQYGNDYCERNSTRIDCDWFDEKPILELEFIYL